MGQVGPVGYLQDFFQSKPSKRATVKPQPRAPNGAIFGKPESVREQVGSAVGEAIVTGLGGGKGVIEATKVLDAAVRDATNYAVEKAIGKVSEKGAEVVLDRVLDLTSRATKIPGVELGTSLFTETAAPGEEAAIARIIEREAAFRSAVTAARFGQEVARVLINNTIVARTSGGIVGAAMLAVLRDP